MHDHASQCISRCIRLQDEGPVTSGCCIVVGEDQHRCRAQRVLQGLETLFAFLAPFELGVLPEEAGEGRGLVGKVVYGLPVEAGETEEPFDILSGLWRLSVPYRLHLVVLGC